MIFLITGRIGSGAMAYANAMKSAGFTCVQNELNKLDGQPVPYDGTPRYAVADPNVIKDILTAFPNELFHAVYIQIDDDDETDRRTRYIAESDKPADEASKIFTEQDERETSMFDEFERGFNTLADKFENFRALHTITNNFDPTTAQEWAGYFYKYHTMYTRLVNLVNLGIKHDIVTHNDKGIVLVLQPKNSTEPTHKFVSSEIFADILLSDDTGLAKLTRTVLEAASPDEITRLA